MKVLMTPPSIMFPNENGRKESSPEGSKISSKRTDEDAHRSYTYDSRLSPRSQPTTELLRGEEKSTSHKMTERVDLEQYSSSRGMMADKNNHQQISPQSKTASNPSELERRNQAILIQAEIPLQLISAYGWTVRECDSVANAVKLKTATGVYAVKETHIPVNRVRFLNRLTQYVRQNGFDRLPRFAITERKHSFFTSQDKVYYATRWIDGSPANFASIHQVGEIAHTLAQFHEASRGFEYSRYNPPMEFHLHQVTRRRVDDLKAMVNEVQMRSDQDEFDAIFLQMAPQLIQDGDRALSILGDEQCTQFLSQDEDTPGICHLDVTPSNFIYDGQKHQAHMIDLDLATFAPRVLDTTHLLRRSLQVQNWASEIAYVVFYRYNAIREFAPAEYRLLLGLLRFPYRAWRLAHTHYRVFRDNSQMDDLIDTRNQEIRRQAFLSAFERELARSN